MNDEPHLPWFERLIRRAEEEGEFDDLPGSGKPIEDLDRSYEPSWWARRFVERERLSEASIALATSIRAELPRVLAERDEAAVRLRLEGFNDEISTLNRDLPEADRMPKLDVERLLVERRARHP